MGLDLKGNKIYSMECINVLYHLKELAEVNFNQNPICVHKDLVQMISEAAPQVEIINKAEVKEPGHVYKSMLQEVKEKIESIKTQVFEDEVLEPPLKGVAVDDFLSQVAADLEEAEVSSTAMTLNKVEALKKRQLNEESEKVRNFGKDLKKLKKLTTDADGEESDEHVNDAVHFKHTIKNQFMDYRSKVRQVMDTLRTTEYETFAKVDMKRDKGDMAAYNKIEEQKRQIKERFQRLGNEKVLRNNLFVESESEEEDFYEASGDEEETGGVIPGSVPGEPVRVGRIDKPLLKTQTVDTRSLPSVNA